MSGHAPAKEEVVPHADRSAHGAEQGGDLGSRRLSRKVQELLGSPAFTRSSQGFNRLPLIKLANALGGPRMKLISADVVESLGRIPRSDEGFASDAVDAIVQSGAMTTEVFMVSHRWLRPDASHPDDTENHKARAIGEFTRWRQSWVMRDHGFRPNILYWLDYSCLDQDDLEVGVPMMPLWIACCERFLRIETPDYHERVWCRLEMMLSKAYSFADHHVVITPQFVNPWPSTGKREDAHLADPATGKMANIDEIELLRPLISHAVRIIKRGRRQPITTRWSPAKVGSGSCAANVEEAAADDYSAVAIKSYVL